MILAILILIAAPVAFMVGVVIAGYARGKCR